MRTLRSACYILVVVEIAALYPSVYYRGTKIPKHARQYLISDPRLSGLHLAVHVLRLHGRPWCILCYESHSRSFERVCINTF